MSQPLVNKAPSTRGDLVDVRLWTDVDSHGVCPPVAHLVGAAGAGMRALATVLRQAGWQVTRSDELLGAHSADHVPGDCRLVAFSPAVSPDNVELAAAHKLGIPTLSYPQMVGLLMRQRLGVAVAGTHGKSTTTAMTASIFREAGLDPTVFVGATPLETSSATAFGRGPVMLAEACEYRESFLHLHPQVAALLGIDWDHVDCFRSPAAVAQAFRRFVAGIPIGGKLVVAVDCAASRTIARESGLRHETFGFGVDADWRAAEISQCLGRYRFRIEQGNVNLGRLRLQVIGRHQVRCALAAAALAGQFGVSAAHILAGLARYAGLERRLELLGEPRGVAVVDDYAHHPTAVRASLASVREAFPDRQVWCVFEPHQAIRTRTLLDDFARSLQNADRIAVADVQLAREPMPSTPSGKASLARAIAEELSWAARAMGRSVALEHTRDEISVLLTRALRPGDVLVTMGAGNIGKCAHEFIHRL